MAKFRARDLRDLLARTPDKTKALRECRISQSGGQLQEGDSGRRLKLSDFSLQDLAYTFGGENWRKRLKEAHHGIHDQELIEAGQAVSSTEFPNITGQLIFSEIRDQFEMEEFVFSQLVPVIQSKIKGTETVAAMASIGDDSEPVLEGQEYPSSGFGEEYFTVAAKTKRGNKVEVTEEMIFFDLTGKPVGEAQKIGKFLGLTREKAIIDCLIGQVNNYSRNGTATNTYLTAGAYINNQSSVQLLDWTDVEAAENLFVDILDPTTSEPIQLLDGEAQLICMPQKVHTARQILGATQVRSTRGTNIETVSENTLSPYTIVSSKLLYRRVLAGPEATASIAQEGWFLGSLQKLLGWYENWPLQVFQQGADSESAFERDVVLRVKARYRGVAQVREPRYMTRNEDTAW